jgi:hypothetical protein
MPATAAKHEPLSVVGFMSDREYYVKVESLKAGFASSACDLETHAEGVVLIADQQGDFEIVPRSDSQQSMAACFYDVGPDI